MESSKEYNFMNNSLETEISNLVVVQPLNMIRNSLGCKYFSQTHNQVTNKLWGYVSAKTKTRVNIKIQYRIKDFIFRFFQDRK